MENLEYLTQWDLKIVFHIEFTYVFQANIRITNRMLAIWITFNIYFDTYSSLIERDVYNLHRDGNDSNDRCGVQLRFKYYLC